jgi:hypothetical protein
MALVNQPVSQRYLGLLFGNHITVIFLQRRPLPHGRRLAHSVEPDAPF